MMLTILIISVIGTGLLADVFGRYFKNYRNHILSFSVSVVLSLICIHIIPEIFSHHEHTLGYYLLAGFILQILLELLSKGIEHGHVHHHGSITKSQLAVIFIGLCTHAFIEGIPIQSFDTYQSHVHANEINLESSFSWIYFTAILIHKLPIAIVLMFFLIKLEVSTLKKYLFLVLFSLTTPLGAIIGEQLMLIESFHEWSPRFLALTTGMLLHITTLLIFEDHNHSKDKFKNLFIIIIGIVFGVCIF